MNYRIVYKDELYHHGVKGMKWGVRKADYNDEGLRSNSITRRLDSLESQESRARADNRSHYRNVKRQIRTQTLCLLCHFTILHLYAPPPILNKSNTLQKLFFYCIKFYKQCPIKKGETGDGSLSPPFPPYRSTKQARKPAKTGFSSLF